jgi:four helix bundle protein
MVNGEQLIFNGGAMARGDDIEDRLIDFAVRTIRACESLPDTPSARHIRGQLLRSGTSPAPNYAEARGAESRRDFIHKLKVVLKELNESRVWLEIIVRSELIQTELLTPLQDECDQLCRIIGRSIQTARNADSH